LRRIHFEKQSRTQNLAKLSPKAGALFLQASDVRGEESREIMVGRFGSKIPARAFNANGFLIRQCL